MERKEWNRFQLSLEGVGKVFRPLFLMRVRRKEIFDSKQTKNKLFLCLEVHLHFSMKVLTL
jgi:hypothetical protein